MDLKPNHFCFDFGLEKVSDFVLNYPPIRFGLGRPFKWRSLVYLMETIWDPGPDGLCLEYPGNNILDTRFKVSK